MPSLSRRALIVSSAALVSAAGKKLKIVVTGGHPGDPEYGCGGTIAKYADAGHDVTLLYLNRGEGGCAGKSGKECGDIRVAEAQRACDILKAQPKFAQQIDGTAIVDGTHYDDFRRLLESEKPDALFTHWPIDNHRDHRAISLLAYDAWLRMGKNFGFYYYEVSDGEDTRMFAPTDYVDISRTASRKRAACFAHASQSPESFYSLQSEITHFRGIESGHPEAEAFVRHVASPAVLLP
jgi:N-acetylglucosamine malate deacetylase 1